VGLERAVGGVESRFDGGALAGDAGGAGEAFAMAREEGHALDHVAKRRA